MIKQLDQWDSWLNPALVVLDGRCYSEYRYYNGDLYNVRLNRQPGGEHCSLWQVNLLCGRKTLGLQNEGTILPMLHFIIYNTPNYQWNITWLNTQKLSEHTFTWCNPNEPHLDTGFFFLFQISYFFVLINFYSCRKNGIEISF